MESTARAFEVRDYVRIFTKRKWFVVLITLAATMIGGLYAVSYPPTYRCQALVLIRQQPIERIRFTEQQTIEPEELREELTLETQAHIATSYDAAVVTANKLGAPESGTKLIVDAQEIVRSLSTLTQEPDRLLIQATSTDRVKAVAFANETADTFVTVISELRRSDVAAARVFLEQQLEEVSERLDGLERELAAYQHQVGIVVPEVEATAAMAQLQQYRNELHTARTQLGVLQARKGTLARQLSAAPQLVTTPVKEAHPEREMLEAQLRQEQTNLATLLARYKEDHPTVTAARRRIDTLTERRDLLPATRETTRFDPNVQVQSLHNEIAATEVAIAETQRRISELQTIVNEVTSETGGLPLELATIERLKSQIQLARNTYQSFMTQLEQSKLREAIKEAGATVIDRAVEAEEIKPRLGRMLIFAFALGLFCGLMFALLLEALDDTFHSPDDLAHYTDVPFLGMVPMTEVTGGTLVTVTAPKSPPAEAYRTLRSNIHFAQVDNPAHTFLVTSAGAGEGKSLTVANLAVVFAQSGQKVLLIDSDLRRPSQQRLFAIDRDYGLTNVLIGESSLEEVWTEIDAVPGLYVVPSGPLPPNPADLLDSERMSQTIQRATELADIVFLDSPPAIVLTDAVLLSAKVDHTLLIAETDHVSRTAFKEMVRLIRQARGSVLGTVLNKLRLSSSDYYYYYYYYYDYTRETPAQRAAKHAQKTEPSVTEVGTHDLFDVAQVDTVESPPSSPTPALQEEQPEEGPATAAVQDKEETAENGPAPADQARPNGTGRKNGNNNKLLDDLLGIDGDDN
jgi:succinoglycan biosynthesis transport protein ExoP